MQQLNGAQALAFARSRTNSSDYARMGRQRCLMQYILSQKSPTDVLTNFRGGGRGDHQQRLHQHPAGRAAGAGHAGRVGHADRWRACRSIPTCPIPSEPNGRFNTGHPDFPYMRQVVQDAIDRDVAAVPPALPTPTADARAPRSTATPDEGPTSVLPPASAVPTSVAASCG